MANEFILKDYNGASVATTLAVNIAAGATSITVTSGAGLLDGSAGPFVITINRGNPTEEKILIASRAGNVLTVQQRGYDGTTAGGHNTPEIIEHTIDAWSIKHANALAGAMTTRGDMASRGAALNFTRIPVGAAGKFLGSDGTDPQWLTLPVSILESLIDAKGDLIVGSADNTAIRKAVGANGLALVADSTAGGGVKWGVPDYVSVGFTPAIVWSIGTVDTIAGNYIQVGKILHIWVSFNIATGSGSGTLTIPLPGGFTAAVKGFAQGITASGGPFGTVAVAAGGTSLAATNNLVAPQLVFVSGMIMVS